MCQLEKTRANEITEPLAFIVCKLELRGKAIVSSHIPGAYGLTVVNHGKTEGKRRASPKQQQTKEQVPQRGFNEAHVLAVNNKGQNKRKKRTSTKQKKAEEQEPQRGFKEVLVSDNEESDDEK